MTTPSDPSPATVSLRPYAPADRSALQTIRQAAFRPIFDSFRAIVGDRIAPTAFARADEEQAEYLDGLLGLGSKAADQPVWVAEVAGTMVGFVAFSLNAETGIGEIDLNAVHPDHAGRGIGTQMFEAVLDQMRAEGMRVATVSTGGDPAHAPARRAYGKVGFTVGIPSISYYREL